MERRLAAFETVQRHAATRGLTLAAATRLLAARRGLPATDTAVCALERRGAENVVELHRLFGKFPERFDGGAGVVDRIVATGKYFCGHVGDTGEFEDRTNGRTGHKTATR